MSNVLSKADIKLFVSNRGENDLVDIVHTLLEKAYSEGCSNGVASTRPPMYSDPGN